MSASFFQNMAPNARRSFVVTTVLGAAAVGIYMFAVQPAEESLAKAHREHDEQANRLQMVNTNLRGAPANKERLASLDAELKPFRDEMLEPLLGSYAMRAKTILEPLALGAGLSNMDYADATVRALPVPRPTPLPISATRASQRDTTFPTPLSCRARRTSARWTRRSNWTCRSWRRSR